MPTEVVVRGVVPCEMDNRGEVPGEGGGRGETTCVVGGRGETTCFVGGRGVRFDTRLASATASTAFTVLRLGCLLVLLEDSKTQIVL